MKVKDVMIREIKSLLPDANAQEALDLLEKMKISGLPVIDSSGKLVGMFTEKDILSYVLPSYLDKVGDFVYEEDSKVTKKKFIGLGKMKVSQLMRKQVVTTTMDASLCEAAKIMLVEKARRVPVLDKNGLVIGIIARCDVLKAFEKEAESVKDS